MNTFKLTKQVKRNIARKVQSRLRKRFDPIVGGSNYEEIDIYYNTENQEYYIDETSKRDKNEAEGKLHYKSLSYFSINGVPTLASIEEDIFENRPHNRVAKEREQEIKVQTFKPEEKDAIIAELSHHFDRVDYDKNRIDCYSESGNKMMVLYREETK